MKRARFSQAQINGIVEEQTGLSTAEVWSKHRLNPATFYKQKAKYVGLGVSGSRRLRLLQQESFKLKELLWSRATFFAPPCLSL